MIVKFPVDKYYWKINFSLPWKNDDTTCYITGDFNCYGDGSIRLKLIDQKWLGSIVLPPGSYKYYFEINQYIHVGHDREKLSKPIELKLPQTALYHDPSSEHFSSNFDGLRTVRCLSPAITNKVSLVYEDGKTVSPVQLFRSDTHNIFEFLLTRNYRYFFQASDDSVSRIGPFEFKLPNSSTPPANTVYQIFSDRFNRSGPTGCHLKQWNELPDRTSFFGGNIAGIKDKLVYFSELGIDHVYLTPFYKSQSNHRYNIDDYFSIDNHFGTLQDLVNLSKSMEQVGISLILDMVFNHTSTRFKKFSEAIEEQDTNARKWYNFMTDHPVPFIGRWKRSHGTIAAQYQCFRDSGGMPKLNHENREVQEFMMSVMSFYAERLHISYLRYDVADSIDVEMMHDLLARFRTKFHQIGHIAEVWCLSPMFVGDGYYDSAMNYPLREIIIKFVSGKISFGKFNSEILKNRTVIGDRHSKQMMNILGTHDTARIATKLDGKKAALLAYAILFVLDGMPTLYYGDEIGLEGGKDPDCRRTFPWNSMDDNLLTEFKKLINFRRDNNITRNGYMKVTRKRSGLFELKKVSGNEELVMFFSLSERPIFGEWLDSELSSNVEKSGEFLKYKWHSYVISIKKREVTTRDSKVSKQGISS